MLKDSGKKIVYSPHFTRKSLRGGGGGRLWCSAGGMCTGGWTKGLLLVENSMTHQGVTLLHRELKHLTAESSV
jgi:hypothetical protein